MERSCWIIEWSAMDIQAGQGTSRKETSICWLFPVRKYIEHLSCARHYFFGAGGGCAGVFVAAHGLFCGSWA